MHNMQISDLNIENLKQKTYLDIPSLMHANMHLCVPGSKSLSNRALLLASICGATTHINGLLNADDTNVMLQALTQLGVDIQSNQNNAVAIHSQKKHAYNVHQAHLDMGNAGTAMRPLTAMLACMALNNNNDNSSTSSDYDYTLYGIQRMHERPIQDLIDALQKLGCNIEYLDNMGYPPVRILGATANSITTSNHDKIYIKGNISSQFLSSLLMAIPIITLNQNRDVTIYIEDDLISKPYVYLTLDTMQKFGVTVTHNLQDEANICLHISAGSCYQTPHVFDVEGDASSASYFIAAGIIAGDTTGVCIDNLGSNSIQGDIAFIHAARLMGANIDLQGNCICAYKSTLHGAIIDCKSIPDAAMTLAILALFVQNGEPTTLYNIASWKVKETDRILAMHTELTKLGAKVTYTHNELTIYPPLPEKWIQPLHGIDTYDDHRMAMCFALCAFCKNLKGIRINNPACVAKTYPQFFEHLYQAIANHV
jgi:3-phosphoshikimate 1-carboxyvinyltransferase